jgi:homoserine O-succinyltransferase
MPDAAFLPTERQFTRLLRSATQHSNVQLRLFYLPDIVRGETVRAQLAERYTPISDLPRAGIDALIVTGCEPVQAHLSLEPYWASVVQVVDWAKDNTVSTIWSCLAAHAAVLHLDAVERERLPRKLMGVYEFRHVSDHPLLRGIPEPIQVPHSRLNGLASHTLARHGYELLTHSEAAGVDAFAKQYGSLFVFLQGHPEYDSDSLGREYRRDLVRFIEGRRDTCPALPENYFDRKTAAALTRFAAEMQAGSDAALLERVPSVGPRPSIHSAWHASASRLFANWIGYIGDAKVRRALPVDQPAIG